MSRIENLEEHLIRLNQIGIALSNEQDLNKLLATILQEARSFTNAEGGTLYSVEGKRLQFMATQNDVLDQRNNQVSGPIANTKLSLSLTKNSMAGYVGLTGEVIYLDDVYEIPADRPYHFNSQFDRQNQYRSKSMLVLPMKGPDGTILGVLQLINARDKKGEIVSFDPQWEELVMSLASQAAVAIRNVRLTEELKSAYFDTIFRLSVAVEYKDGETVNHIRRMAHYAALIAEEIGFDKDQVELIHYASPMHDIGKIGISESILHKPDQLTPAEYEEMKLHTVMGGRIFAGAKAPVLKMSASIALTHHEKHDGSGYPKGLKGDEIPIEGRIAALADVFDALSSNRCYKPSIPVEKCLEMIKTESGYHFHPEVVDAFMRRLDDVLTIRENYP
ncbi:MAG: HD domain-containing protein [Planctomycetota bacterium]|nr:MAG: HD domain-containing protein [Planctomycetota bacterium]